MHITLSHYTPRMAVFMYTLYSDLFSPYLEDEKHMRNIQAERDSRLFHLLHNKKKIPLFPLDPAVFESKKDDLAQISMNDDVLYMQFVTPDTCMVLHCGNFKEYKSQKEAYLDIFGFSKDKNLVIASNKYKVLH